MQLLTIVSQKPGFCFIKSKISESSNSSRVYNFSLQFCMWCLPSNVWKIVSRIFFHFSWFCRCKEKQKKSWFLNASEPSSFILFQISTNPGIIGFQQKIELKNYTHNFLLKNYHNQIMKNIQSLKIYFEGRKSQGKKMF